MKSTGSLRLPTSPRLALLGAIACVAAALFLAGPAAAGGTPEYQSGDLVVSTGQTQVYENRTVILSGNVTVASGGSLVLRNSTIALNLTANGSLALTVQAGGELRLLDLDGAPQTLLDASEIGSFDPALRYLAYFDAGSGVLVRNSALTGFGYSLLVPGLLVMSDNVTFENATVRSYTYLKVQGASPRFEGTYFEGEGAGSNYFFGSSAVIADCTFARHFVALSALQGSALDVRNAVIRDSAFSVAINASTLSLNGASLNNTSAGVFLTNGSHLTFTDVTFNESAVAFGDVASVLEVRRAFFVVALNTVSEPVRGANVTVRNATAALVGSGATGPSGAAGAFSLLLFLQDGSGRVDEGNYTVNVTKGANATEHAFSPFTEASPITLTLPSNIDPRLTLVSPTPGSTLLSGTDHVFEAQVSDPDGPTASLTVTWLSSLAGPLGAGTRLVAALPPGLNTIEVEVRDADGGYRILSFNLTADPGRLEVYTDGAVPPGFQVEIWKVPQGGVEIVDLGAGAGAGAQGAVGHAFDVHAANGSLQWSWARLSVHYEPADLWYGVNESSLHLVRLGASLEWAIVPGSVVNVTTRSVTANISAAGGGLGTFLIVGSQGTNLPPILPAPPRLVAVRGVSFTFTLNATDSPGDSLTYSLIGAPEWLTVDSSEGTLAGTPNETARGLLNITVVVSDLEGANATTFLEIFVTGAAVNQPPRLANALVLPAHPVPGEQVVIQVTYYDADDDAPVVLDVEIDGSSFPMEPVNLRDVNVTDGKEYVYRTVLGAGNHTIVFRVNDGFPARADLEPIQTSVTVRPDVLLQLDNWFLALLASVAATLFIVVWLAVRAPKDSKENKPKPKEPEDSIAFLEGKALKPIPPPPPRPKRAPDKEDALEAEADILAGVAERDEKEAGANLKAAKVADDDD